MWVSHLTRCLVSSSSASLKIALAHNILSSGLLVLKFRTRYWIRTSDCIACQKRNAITWSKKYRALVPTQTAQTKHFGYKVGCDWFSTLSWFSKILKHDAINSLIMAVLKVWLCAFIPGCIPCWRHTLAGFQWWGLGLTCASSGRVVPAGAGHRPRRSASCSCPTWTRTTKRKRIPWPPARAVAGTKSARFPQSFRPLQNQCCTAEKNHC